MTQQTLREELPKYKNGSKAIPADEIVVPLTAVDQLLARFKEFAEKELIGEDTDHTKKCNDRHEKEELWCCLDCYDDGKINALRNKQREILAEKLK